MTRLTEGMSYERYMQLYTAAYNYCISSGMSGAGGMAAGAHLVGGELYARVVAYLERHLDEVYLRLEPLRGEALLQAYAREWERYTNGANFVHRLLVYLNRHWVKHEREEGRTDVHTVYTLALVQWLRHLFQPLQVDARLTSAVLRMIAAQRDGEVVPTALLKCVLDSAVSLGIDHADTTRLNLDVYVSEFQTPLLEATRTYYRSMSQAFLQAHPVTDYLVKAAACLEDEESRVELYMHHSTSAPLLETCRAELVAAHAPRLWDQFDELLRQDLVADLGRLYALLLQMPGGLDPLRERFEAHAKQCGLDAVAQLTQSEADAADPSKYVQALLGVYEHQTAIIAQAFQNEAGFSAALDKACRAYMNVNAVTGTSASKSPELVAKFIDGVLKKSARPDDTGATLEEALDKAMDVFKYMEDRDYFQKFYAKFLSRRLVSFSSVSADAEESMISRLKDLCGFEYTSKLQRMFTEAGLSKELNDRFQASELAPASPISFYSFVLTTGVWPLAAPSSDFRVPAALQPTHDAFTRFYHTQHTHRQLTWLWHLSTNELHATLQGRKYVFLTSTYQAAILLLFNTHEVLTLDELAAETRLEPNVLQAALTPMVRLKVLHLLDDSYSLNLEFKGKKVRINLNLPVRAEQKAEAADVARTVHEDRKVLLQATIVRIMKARKTLKHSLLLNEVITQLQSRFQPKVPDMKKVRGASDAGDRHPDGERVSAARRGREGRVRGTTYPATRTSPSRRSSSAPPRRPAPARRPAGAARGAPAPAPRVRPAPARRSPRAARASPLRQSTDAPASATPALIPPIRCRTTHSTRLSGPASSAPANTRRTLSSSSVPRFA